MARWSSDDGFELWDRKELAPGIAPTTGVLWHHERSSKERKVNEKKSSQVITIIGITSPIIFE